MRVLFKNGLEYIIKWTIFVIIASLLTVPVPPEIPMDDFWSAKLLICALMIPYSIIFWILFTPTQNYFNSERNNTKLGFIIFISWILGKFIIYGLNYLIYN